MAPLRHKGLLKKPTVSASGMNAEMMGFVVHIVHEGIVPNVHLLPSKQQIPQTEQLIVAGIAV